MMKKVWMVLAVVFSLAVMSCKKDRISGSGSVITQERSVSNFTKIQASGSNNVQVTQGSTFKVEVRGYANLLPYYETKLVNGTLELGYKNNTHVRNDNIEVFVTLPVLHALSSAGSGNITTTGNFAGNASFETHISGSSNITVGQGSSENYSSTISGSGNIHALGFVAEKADIRISGSGNNEITATETLNVVIAGSGNVYYLGSPVITVQTSGSGAVIPR